MTQASNEKPSAPVKAKMQAWAEQHPGQAAERRVAREREREQRRAATLLSQLIGPEMIEKAAERLDGLLDAQQPVVVNLPSTVEDGKLVPGGQVVQFVADNRTQLDAIKVVAAYTEGLPVARQMVLHGDFKDLDADQRDVLLGSSAVQEALKNMEIDASELPGDPAGEPKTSSDHVDGQTR